MSRVICILLLSLALMPTLPDRAAAAADDATECAAVVELLRKHEKKTARELRQIKREIAALRQSESEPGLQEIMGGIGYILGLCGVAALVASRRRPKS